MLSRCRAVVCSEDAVALWVFHGRCRTVIGPWTLSRCGYQMAGPQLPQPLHWDVLAVPSSPGQFSQFNKFSGRCTALSAGAMLFGLWLQVTNAVARWVLSRCGLSRGRCRAVGCPVSAVALWVLRERCRAGIGP